LVAHAHPRLRWLHHTFDEGELAGIAIALVCALMMFERGDAVFPSGLLAFVAGPLTLFGVLSAADLASADMRQLLARLERAVGLFDHRTRQHARLVRLGGRSRARRRLFCRAHGDRLRPASRPDSRRPSAPGWVSHPSPHRRS
jgi:hypothetical protein